VHFKKQNVAPNAEFLYLFRQFVKTDLALLKIKKICIREDPKPFFFNDTVTLVNLI
jgi:hypothetical protein